MAAQRRNTGGEDYKNAKKDAKSHRDARQHLTFRTLLSTMALIYIVPLNQGVLVFRHEAVNNKIVLGAGKSSPEITDQRDIVRL